MAITEGNDKVLRVYTGGPTTLPSLALIIRGSTADLSAVGGDFNGDGKPDLAVLEAGNAVRVFWSVGNLFDGQTVNLGDANFTISRSLAAPVTVLAGGFDLNGDRVADLLLGSPGAAAGQVQVRVAYGARAVDPTIINSQTDVLSHGNGLVVGESNQSIGSGVLLDRLDTRVFRFRTIGDGLPGDALWLSGPGVVFDLYDTSGVRLSADRTTADLRHLDGGTYFVRVRVAAGATVPAGGLAYTFAAKAPLEGQNRLLFSNPDRDELRGDDGTDKLSGNRDLDRIVYDPINDSEVTAEYGEILGLNPSVLQQITRKEPGSGETVQHYVDVTVHTPAGSS